MVAINESDYQACCRMLTKFFNKFPNDSLQLQAYHWLKCFQDFKIPMKGKAGGWAGGIIYAVCNQYRQACGIPGLLNSECEAFFGVSMSTIHKRAWMIRGILAGEPS